MKESMEGIDLISLVSVGRAILESLPFDSCSKWSNTPLNYWADMSSLLKTPIPKILYGFDHYVDIFACYCWRIFTGELSVHLEVWLAYAIASI